MTGRIFTTCTLIVDMMDLQDKETLDYINCVIESAIATIGDDVPVSVRLTATRCLIKFLRKLPQENLPKMASVEKGLKPLLDLLTQSPLECVQLPVEAFAALSKHYEGIVS